MKRLTIQAYPRTQIGGIRPRKIVQQGYLPGVLYGGKNQPTLHLYIAASDIKPLNYEPYFIELHLQDQQHPCILQHKQIHPVSDIPIHIDLLRMTQDKPIVMEIPVKLEGEPIGTKKGGLLVKKIRKLKVKALPQNMPEKVTLDVFHLDLGQNIQVKQTKTQNFELLNNPTSLVVAVEIPRALRSKKGQEDSSSSEAS